MKKIIFLSFAFLSLTACSAVNSPQSESKPSDSLMGTSQSSEAETSNTITYDFPSLPTEVTIKTILYTDQGQKEKVVSELTNPIEISAKTGKFTLSWLSDEEFSNNSDLRLTLGKETYHLGTSEDDTELDEDNTQLAYIFEVNDSLTVTKLNEPYRIAMVGSTSDPKKELNSSRQILKYKDFKQTTEFKQYERVTITSLEFN